MCLRYTCVFIILLDITPPLPATRNLLFEFNLYDHSTTSTNIQWYCLPMHTHDSPRCTVAALAAIAVDHRALYRV